MNTKEYQVNPSVDAELGESTICYRATNNELVIEKLELMFQDWFGDCIITTCPIFACTNELKTSIEQLSIANISFEVVHSYKSLEFEDMHPEMILPTWFWMRLGTDKADFYTNKGQLIVSETGLKLLKAAGLEHADIIPLQRQ